jgi:glycosyltransferase involved in cell wall biosynthesis
MKVLVLAPPMQGVGGVQQYTATLVRALGAIFGERNTRLVAVPAEPELLPDGTFAFPRSVKFRFLARAIVEALRWRPDLMICTHLGVAAAASVVKIFFGIPYWIILHGIEVWGDLPSAKLRALQRAERLVANSRFTLEATVSRHTQAGNKSSVLPPAIEYVRPTELAPNAEDARPIVLTVGRLAASERYKGHDVMLEAWVDVHRRVPDAVYEIVGDGDDRPRLEARARELGIHESVKFVGTLSGIALEDSYERCRVFALPSKTDLDPRGPRGEGFGIVFVEAMAHCKPVVGPKSGAPAEFIRDGEHGILVDPASPLEVANALVTLLEQPARARQLGRTAGEWVRQEFSFERFCARLKKVLAEENRA